MADARHSLYDFGPLVASYEQWYDTPLGEAHDQAQQQAIRRLLPPARPGDRLLEVGCGTGHWSRFFASLGYDVMGLDISPEAIEAARARRTPGCHFEVGDACSLPSPVRKYRIVAAITALEFISDPEEALAGMARCRESDGLLLAGTLNALSPMNRRRVAEKKEPYASARLLSPGDLRQLLARHGTVKMAEADGETVGTRAGLPARLWAAIKLHYGCSLAPFIAATAQPQPRR